MPREKILLLKVFCKQEASTFVGCLVCTAPRRQEHQRETLIIPTPDRFFCIPQIVPELLCASVSPSVSGDGACFSDWWQGLCSQSVQVADKVW